MKTGSFHIWKAASSAKRYLQVLEQHMPDVFFREGLAYQGQKSRSRSPQFPDVCRLVKKREDATQW